MIFRYESERQKDSLENYLCFLVRMEVFTLDLILSSICALLIITYKSTLHVFHREATGIVLKVVGFIIYTISACITTYAIFTMQSTGRIWRLGLRALVHPHKYKRQLAYKLHFANAFLILIAWRSCFLFVLAYISFVHMLVGHVKA